MKLLLVLALLGAAIALSDGVLVCYSHPNKASYAEFEIEDIDPFLCTHIIYAFAGIDWNYKVQVLDPHVDLCDNGGKCGYDRFTGLKQLNPELITTLATGGANGAPARYSQMAADPALRKAYIESVLALLNAHDFDGFNVDWNFPTMNGGKPEDKANYVILMSELADALHADGGKILTASVSAIKGTIDQAYDVPGLAAAADLIHILGYDLHGEWEHYTHHHTILYPYPEDEGDTLYLNLDYAVQYWLSLGTPKEKLVLGMATYGHCWNLNNAQDTGMYAPAYVGGQYSYYVYNKLCTYYKDHPEVPIVREASMNEPYAYDLSNKNLWCGYDDEASYTTKAAYARDQGLAGAMVWLINYDDFLGLCHDRPYHMIKTIGETLAATP